MEGQRGDAARETVRISIQEWHALAGAGYDLPVTITLDGDSMRPLIRRGMDPVTIIPLKRPLMRGDVVLFRLGEKYIVHRVWQLKNGFVRTLGDHCVNPEPWFPEQQALGLAVRYVRDGRSHRLDTPAARAWGRGWMAMQPLRRMYWVARGCAARLVRRVVTRFRKK